MPATQWLKLLLAHIPDKYEHLVRYYGFYSNRARDERNTEAGNTTTATKLHLDETPADRTTRAHWARLIQKVYEVDPLECPKCGHTMRLIAVIDEAAVIRKILQHLCLRNPHPEEPEPPGCDPPWPANSRSPSPTIPSRTSPEKTGEAPHVHGIPKFGLYHHNRRHRTS